MTTSEFEHMSSISENLVMKGTISYIKLFFNIILIFFVVMGKQADSSTNIYLGNAYIETDCKISAKQTCIHSNI